MKIYCLQCGTPLEEFTDIDRQRCRCPQCGWIRYRNPTVGVAVIVIDGNELLLTQRRNGMWCIPCGHVSWDETVEDAARRELLEETGLECDLAKVFSVQSNFHDPDHHTVGIWYLAAKTRGQLCAGDDAVNVDFWKLDELPGLAFPTDSIVVKDLRQLM